MKNTNTCPKCNSKNILKIPGKVGAYGSGNNIPTGWSTLSAVKVTRYLCEDCGFTEEWINNKDDINKLVNKYRN